MKTKIFLISLILVLAFFSFASITQAVPLVSIEPSQPTTDDDLTCLIEGRIEALGFGYEWYINRNQARGELNAPYTLSNARTEAGDRISCVAILPGIPSIPAPSEEVIILESDRVPTRNTNPAVEITNPLDNTILIEGNEMMFTARGSDPDAQDTILTYEWDFGDRSPRINTVSLEGRGQGGVSTVRHTFESSGEYVISVKVSDPREGSNRDQIRVTVIKDIFNVENIRTYNDRFETETSSFFRDESLFTKFQIVNEETGEAVPDLDIDAYLLNPETGRKMQVEPFTGILSIWTRIINGQRALWGGLGLGDGTYYYVLEDIPDNADFLGENILFVIAFDLPNGGGQGQKVVTIVNRNPVAIISPIQGELVPGRTITLDASRSYDPDGRIVQYEWFISKERGQLGEEIALRLEGPQIQYTIGQTGSFNVVLRVTDNEGGVTEKRIALDAQTENEFPVAVLNVAENVLVNEEVVFDASRSYDPDGEIVEYLWSFDDETPAISSGSNPRVTHTFTRDALGSRTIQLSVVDDRGLQDSDFKTIRVRLVPKTPDRDKERTNSFQVAPSYAHNTKIASVAPLSYQAVYVQGDPLNLLVKLDNQGLENEKVFLELTVLNTDKYTLSPTIRIQVGDSEIISTKVNTAGLAKGKYTLQIKAKSPEHAQSDLTYWQFSIN